MINLRWLIAHKPDYLFVRTAEAFQEELDKRCPNQFNIEILTMGKYIKKYVQAGTMANYDGLDPHDDNKWEEKAEKFAKKELRKWM